MNDRAIIIFVKNPVLGKVKTRLAKDLGPEKALAIYHQLLMLTCNAVVQVDADKHLFYSDHVDLADIWPNEHFRKYVQQPNNDLGERMYSAFEETFDKGYKKVLIIGSDCPDISAEVIEQAFAALENHDVVIGPAKDGGYYLLGMNELEKEYFKGKEWSTSSVREDTISSAKALGKKFVLLEELRDVDHADDLTDIKISLSDL